MKSKLIKALALLSAGCGLMAAPLLSDTSAKENIIVTYADNATENIERSVTLTEADDKITFDLTPLPTGYVYEVVCTVKGTDDITYIQRSDSIEFRANSKYDANKQNVYEIYSKVGSDDSDKTLKYRITVNIQQTIIEESVVDKIKSFLDNNTVLIVVATTCITIIFRVGLKIFRMGASYKMEYVSKEEFTAFKEEIQQDVRKSKADMQDTVLKVCLREIARETEPVHELKDLADELKTDKEVLRVQIATLEEKSSDISQLKNSVSNLEKSVRAIQYGDTTSGERRIGK